MSPLTVDQFPERYAAAVFAKDADALLSLYDDDVRLFDLWGVWSYEGAPAWRQSVDDWFASLGAQRVGVGFEDVSIIGSDHLATVHAIITYRDLSPDGTERGSMQNRLTWVLTRTNDQWKIIHEHTSAPVNFDTATVILQRN